MYKPSVPLAASLNKFCIRSFAIYTARLLIECYATFTLNRQEWHTTIIYIFTVTPTDSVHNSYSYIVEIIFYKAGFCKFVVHFLSGLSVNEMIYASTVPNPTAKQLLMLSL